MSSFVPLSHVLRNIIGRRHPVQPAKSFISSRRMFIDDIRNAIQSQRAPGNEERAVKYVIYEIRHALSTMSRLPLRDFQLPSATRSLSHLYIGPAERRTEHLSQQALKSINAFSERQRRICDVVINVVINEVNT